VQLPALEKRPAKSALERHRQATGSAAAAGSPIEKNDSATMSAMNFSTGQTVEKSVSKQFPLRLFRRPFYDRARKPPRPQTIPLLLSGTKLYGRTPVRAGLFACAEPSRASEQASSLFTPSLSFPASVDRNSVSPGILKPSSSSDSECVYLPSGRHAQPSHGHRSSLLRFSEHSVWISAGDVRPD
jgi:hypothetical protein